MLNEMEVIAYRCMYHKFPIFSQCIDFLNALIGTWKSKNWETELLEIECWQWLKLLLNHLKVNEGRHRPLLDLLLTSQNQSIRKLRDFIKEHVRN